MTLEQLLAIPKGMNIKEYESLLNEKGRLEKQMRKASESIMDEIDSLEVLADEVGSERYNKHLTKKQKTEEKLCKVGKKLLDIEAKINKR